MYIVSAKTYYFCMFVCFAFMIALLLCLHTCMLSSDIKSLLNRVPYVPYVPSCLACPRTLVPTSLAYPHAHVPSCLACPCALVPSCLACPCALRAHVPCVPTCPRAIRFLAQNDLHVLKKR